LTVRGVSKSFRLPREQVHTLKERALHPFRRSGFDEFRALHDVTFGVQRGEFFGIVGRNGSGKSTLLKCMAGILRVDAGDIHVEGRLSTFIELGVGFNPDLAAYDNVMLNAAMLGLSTREARRRFDAVIDFAELREFADLKIKNYSSGMLVRLAFAVMIQVDADVLLIDEVLAVGDAAFQQKCFDEFVRIRQAGTTVVLVTHDMGAVERFCDRAMLLERGRQVELGGRERVASRYLQLNFSSEAREELAEEADAPAVEPQGAPDGAPSDEAQAPAEEEPVRLGDQRAEILEAWFEDGEAHRIETLPTRQPLTCGVRIAFHEDVTDPAVGVELTNGEGRLVLGAHNLKEPPAGTFPAGSEAVFRFRMDAPLAPDRYWLTAAVARDATSVYFHDRRAKLTSIVVAGVIEGPWLLDVPASLTVERAGTPVGERT
jgi:ABC-type polysaccharide/polyol phosphate transport system ATPase subunit